MQDPCAERHDQTDLLGEGKKVGRRQQPALRMAPAQERLEAGHRVLCDIDDRLIVNLELTLAQGRAQIQLEQAPHLHKRVHSRLEEAGTSPPLTLGAVERKVGVLEQLLGAGAIAGAHGNADARTNDDLMAIDLIGCTECFDDPVRQLRGRRRLAGGHLRHGELVTAEARDRIRAADEATQARGHELQQRISDRMAERVVDVLEPVEVEAEDGHALILLVQGLLDLLLEQVAVRQIRQGIVPGHMVDTGLGLAPIRDVLVGADPASAIDGVMDDADGAPIIELDDAEVRLPLLDQFQNPFDVFLAVGAFEAAGLQAAHQHVAKVRAAGHHVTGEAIHLAVSIVADDEPLCCVEHDEADRHVVDGGIEVPALTLGRLGQAPAVGPLALHVADAEGNEPAEQRCQEQGDEYGERNVVAVVGRLDKNVINAGNGP